MRDPDFAITSSILRRSKFLVQTDLKISSPLLLSASFVIIISQNLSFSSNNQTCKSKYLTYFKVPEYLIVKVSFGARKKLSNKISYQTGAFFTQNSFEPQIELYSKLK
jgi:hypothetical protein